MNNNNTELKNNLSFFNMVFQTISEGLIILNDIGEIILINSRIVELFDYKEEELLGKTIEILIPKKYKTSHVKHREDYTENPIKKTMGIGRVLEGQKKDGSTFNSEVSLNYLVLEGKKYIIALVTDVTKRVKIEKEISELNLKLEKKVKERTKELEDSQFLYSAVARNFPNGTINVFDKNLNYIFAEGKELYEFGINSQKLIGTSYLKRLSLEIRPTIEKELNDVFKGKSKDFELEYKTQFYRINAVPLYNENNEIDKILVVEKNITPQKIISQKLEQSLEKEKEINEMKSRFVSMASHEFRTPLSTILSSTALIDKYIEKNQPENTNKHIKRIKSSVKGLTEILNDFLSADKLENNSVKAKFEPFNYVDFTKEIVEDLTNLRSEGQEIITKIETDNEIINSDKSILRNIFYNLISNAIKYSKENQEIIVQSKITDDYLYFEIIDKGIGIPQKEQKNLFTRFFRAENVENIKGTGLGLTIVKSYLNLLNGEISFVSKENKGTTFKCKIPLNHE